jgi:AraC family cel operon transcriptional repressor
MLERKRWRRLAGTGEWFHLARVQFHPARLSRLHTHDFPEIFWVEQGQGVHHINGQAKKLFSADLILIRPQDRHAFGFTDHHGFTLVNLAFPLLVLTELGQRLPELAPLHDARAVLPVRRALSSVQSSHLKEEVRRLATTGRGRLPLERFLLNIYSMLLVEPERRTRVVLPEWLERACAEIQRPEYFGGGVPAFVRLAGRSAEYVARSCRRMLGATPTEFVNRIRMEHAARELRLGAKPIMDICLECGFNNLAHFYTLFRAAHGEPPRRYRMEHQRTVL